MAGIREAEQTHSLVQSFSGARSALEEVFQYYKVGRYREAFLEKPYFLLSRCTHVLFSLWLAGQDSERGFFCMASPPAAFALGLDFGELRYSEYRRRMLHADLLEEYLRNETKWFEFWMRILQLSDKSNTGAYQEFCHYLLAWARKPGFLEGKADRANRKALHRFLTSHEAGRVLTGTIRVLEDLLRAIVGCFAASEVRTCVVEQVIVLAGLLREMRRIIVWETPAKGPYALCGKARWRTQSLLRRLSRHRAQGLLTVIPKREGGEILCTFQPTPGSPGRRAFWVGRMTSLEGTYEAELFATWSYDSGEHQEQSRPFPDRPACWTVQNTEAGRLEVLSKQIDSLLDVLQRDPVYTELVAAVKRVSRTDAPEWTAMSLPWTYVRRLDQLVGKLTFVYREAKAVGGDDAAQNVIEQIWPSEKATTDQGETCNGQNPQQEKTSHGLPFIPVMESARTLPNQVVSGTLAFLLQKLGDARSNDEKNAANEPKRSSILPERADKTKDAEPVSPRSVEDARAAGRALQKEVLASGESAMRESEQGLERPSSARQMQRTEQEQESKRLQSAWHPEQKDPEAESGSGAPAAAVDRDQPNSAKVAGPPRSMAADPEGAAVSAPRELSQQCPTRVTRTANADRSSEMDRALLQTLLEHHERLGRTINCEPLSCAELQRNLGWSESKVQRAMTNVFGPKPASTYRRKCKDRTISTFLKAQATSQSTHRVPIRAQPQMAGTASGTPVKGNPRRKSGRRLSVRR